MLGVTFAIGEGWKECGEFAAERMRITTGLECHVVSEWPEDPGVLVNPSWLKLWAQDMFPGEDLMLFDADIVSMKPWSPEELLAGYDFAFAREYYHFDCLQRECREYGLDLIRYGNCGLILIKADCTALQESRHHYPAFGKWLEQTGVNQVLQKDLTRWKIHLFPRAFNRLWPVFRLAENLVGKHQVNLHFCNLRGNSSKLRKIQHHLSHQINHARTIPALRGPFPSDPQRPTLRTVPHSIRR